MERNSMEFSDFITYGNGITIDSQLVDSRILSTIDNLSDAISTVSSDYLTSADKDELGILISTTSAEAVESANAYTDAQTSTKLDKSEFSKLSNEIGLSAANSGNPVATQNDISDLTAKADVSDLSSYLSLSGGSVSGDVEVIGDLSVVGDGHKFVLEDHARFIANGSDVEIYNGNYRQTTTLSGYDVSVINYSYKNSFLQAEIVKDHTEWGIACTGSKGYCILSVYPTLDAVKLSGDISLLEANVDKKYSYAFGSGCGSEVFEIKSIDPINKIVEFKSELGTYLSAAKLSSEEQMISAFDNDDNALYCPSDPTIGNAIIHNFYANHGEGGSIKAIGKYTHAEGRHTTADNRYSHAEGDSTFAGGIASHSEGQSTKAHGFYAHAEGKMTNAYGQSSHAEGQQTSAIGDYSHAEGYQTYTIGKYSHVEGNSSIAEGESSHAQNINCQAIGDASHAEGYQTHAIGKYSHSEGYQTSAIGDYSHVEGYRSIAFGEKSAAFGNYSSTNQQPELSTQQLIVLSSDNIIKWTINGGWAIAIDEEKSSEKCISETSSTTYTPATLNSWANSEYEIIKGYPNLEDGRFYRLPISNVHRTLYSMSAISGGDQIDGNAFIWNGKDGGSTSDSNGIRYYHSHGQGTFNINPENGLSGFYVGNDSLCTLIDNSSNKTETNVKQSISQALSSIFRDDQGGEIPLQSVDISKLVLSLSSLYLWASTL